MNWVLIQNSLLVGGVTAVLATGLGFVGALTLAITPSRLRRFLLLATIISFALPPFLVTNCWLDLLGHNGALRRWLPFNLYSLGGAVWLLTLLSWPISTLLVLGAWQRLERSQLESDAALHATALIRWLLWPMARVATGQAAALTFVLALNNFAIPVILQVPVFPEELWLAFTTRLNDAGAWAAAWPMVVIAVVALILLRRADISWPRTEGPVTAAALRRQLGKVWICSAVVTGALLLLSLGLPLAQLILTSRTWIELPNLFRAAPNVIWNSFAFAATSATACVAIGLVSWRLPLSLVLWLPFLMPGVLLGRALIFAFNGSVIYGTTSLVVLAFTARYLAVGWNGAALALRGVDRDLSDAGKIAGARGWTLLRHIHWPQIAPQIAAAWYVTYLLCLWDVETLVLIYPPGGETLALRIFNLLHYGHNAQVNAMCVMLLVLAVAPLLGWGAWRWVFRRKE